MTYVSTAAKTQRPPINLDLDNLMTDHNYAQREKDLVNHELVDAKTYQTAKYIPQHKPKRPKKRKHVKPF